MPRTTRSIHDIDMQDDLALLQETVRRAIAWLVMGVLAATFASVGVLVYVTVTDSARAGPGLDASHKRFELLGGLCRYSEVGNYVWHNTHYPYQLDMTGSCGLVAYTKLKRYRGALSIGKRIAYVDMGRARTNAVFPMRDEEQISVLPDGSSCNPLTGFGCIGRGHGVQTARGLSYGYVAEWSKDRWAWGGEFGIFAYLGSWVVHITPEAPSDFRPMTFDWEGWQLTPFVGVSLRYGYVHGTVRAYGRIRAAEHGCGMCSGVANSTAIQAVIGASVPF